MKYPYWEKPGPIYTNVHGNYAEIDYNTPFILVMYSPLIAEAFFISYEEAVSSIPPFGHWEILNGLTGEVLLSGISFEKDKYDCK